MLVGRERNSGLTLIELLLYVGISSVVLLAVAGFLGSILNTRVKNQTINEIEQQGNQNMQLITQTVRNATAINSPAAGVSAASLSINVPEPTDSPTVFDVVDGVLRITKGTADPVALTSPVAEVVNITFDNLSIASTPGTIRVQFELEYKSHSSRNEYQWSKTFFGSASLR